MRKIIYGRMYNTETAECIGEYENMEDAGNFRYYSETLYKKRNGEFFLVGEGNALSPYGECRGSMRMSGERFTPYEEEEAKEWVEQHCDAETYIELFGEPEE